MDTRMNVLACVDRSRYAASVADYAAWAARRLGLVLEFLHVIDPHAPVGPGQDHSGAIGPDAQEHLMTELSGRDEARSRREREAGRLFLNDLRMRALAAGATSVDVRQRLGRLDETIAEQQARTELFVLGRRGASAEATGRDLGRQLEWVVRAVDRPLLVAREQYTEPSRVLLAFDGGSMARRGIESIVAGPLLRGLPIHVLMVGKPGAAAQLEWAGRTLEGSGFEVTTELLPGDPETVIARTVKARGIDLLVMGAYSHSPLRALLVGSRTTELLRAASVSTLLLR